MLFLFSFIKCSHHGVAFCSKVLTFSCVSLASRFSLFSFKSSGHVTCHFLAVYHVLLFWKTFSCFWIIFLNCPWKESFSKTTSSTFFAIKRFYSQMIAQNNWKDNGERQSIGATGRLIEADPTSITGTGWRRSSLGVIGSRGLASRAAGLVLRCGRQAGCLSGMTVRLMTRLNSAGVPSHQGSACLCHGSFLLIFPSYISLVEFVHDVRDESVRLHVCVNWSFYHTETSFTADCCR